MVNVGKNPSQQFGVGKQSSIFDQIPLPIVIGVPIAVLAGVAIFFRRRKSHSQKLKMLTGNNTDIVTMLDSSDKKKNES